MSITESGVAGYYVKVLSILQSSFGPQKVVNPEGVPYSIKSAVAAYGPGSKTVDLHATRENFAGAFNILELASRGAGFVSAIMDSTLPPITWEWPRKNVSIIDCPSSCYEVASRTIFVDGSTGEDDSYDDSVLGHEFGHAVVWALSKAAPLNGIQHKSNEYSSPTVAWSEGAATFIGQSILGVPIVLKSKANGVKHRESIEEVGGLVFPGTSGSKLDGAVSETTVAAILWDLADNASDTNPSGPPKDKDRIFNQILVFKILRQFSTYGQDRGFEGPDLVDFLDLWLCSGYRKWEDSPANDMYAVVNGVNRFPYTSVGKPPCP